MGYHVEDRSYPGWEQGIVTSFSINDASELECPKCGGMMLLVDNGYDERYFQDGRMERTERYYCDDCSTFADITQVYEPTTRRVKVMQDVYDD